MILSSRSPAITRITISFVRSVFIEHPEMRPVCDPDTFESNVPGIYVAGVVVSGSRTSEIFIENGRFHGKKIAQDLAKKMKATFRGEPTAEIETQPIITRTHWVNKRRVICHARSSKTSTRTAAGHAPSARCIRNLGAYD